MKTKESIVALLISLLGGLSVVGYVALRQILAEEQTGTPGLIIGAVLLLASGLVLVRARIRKSSPLMGAGCFLALLGLMVLVVGYVYSVQW